MGVTTAIHTNPGSLCRRLEYVLVLFFFLFFFLLHSVEVETRRRPLTFDYEEYNPGRSRFAGKSGLDVLLDANTSTQTAPTVDFDFDLTEKVYAYYQHVISSNTVNLFGHHRCIQRALTMPEDSSLKQK